MNLAVFVSHMARTLWVCAWADAVEAHGERLPRGDLMTQAPPTPRAARDEALRLLGAIEAMSGRSAWVLLAAARRADGQDPDTPVDREYAASFAHYLVMMALGHGVSWFDDHALFKLELPHWEAKGVVCESEDGPFNGYRMYV